MGPSDTLAGDHCYNMGQEDELRADGYMDAYATILSRLPWIPVIGSKQHAGGGGAGRE